MSGSESLIRAIRGQKKLMSEANQQNQSTDSTEQKKMSGSESLIRAIRGQRTDERSESNKNNPQITQIPQNKKR